LGDLRPQPKFARFFRKQILPFQNPAIRKMQIHVCQAKKILKDLDQPEDEATTLWAV
jgi:hypothetical protein